MNMPHIPEDTDSSGNGAVPISLVIPVYNEESHLAACLDAVALQTVPPHEVLIVDNNSTDATVAIAARYPFVHVIHEHRQGVVHARNAGFNAASGTVIGRIDADTILSPDWVETLQRLFAADAPAIDAVSGSIGFYDVPFSDFFSSADLFFRLYIARNLARLDEMFLYGGNMAIRRTVWRAVRQDLCRQRRFHEDIDLAAHLAHQKLTLAFDPSLRVRVSARRVDSSAGEFYAYVTANSRTYAAHALTGRLYMQQVEFLIGIAYPLLRLLYRSYDAKRGRLSLHRLVAQQTARPARISPLSERL